MQTIEIGNQEIWEIEFSHSGNMLASAGKYSIVNVWEMREAGFIKFRDFELNLHEVNLVK